MEGPVDHHLLAIHHVVEGDHRTLADITFLVAGVALVAIGAVLVRSTAPPRGFSTSADD